MELGEGIASDAEGRFEAGKKNGVVDNAKSGSEIQGNEDGEVTRDCGEMDVVGDFEVGCFNAVLRTD